jgi:hypothetical protein
MTNHCSFADVTHKDRPQTPRPLLRIRLRKRSLHRQGREEQIKMGEFGKRAMSCPVASAASAPLCGGGIRRALSGALCSDRKLAALCINDCPRQTSNGLSCLFQPCPPLSRGGKGRALWALYVHTGGFAKQSNFLSTASRPEFL